MREDNTTNRAALRNHKFTHFMDLPCLLGALQRRKNSKKSEITIEVGGWVQVLLGIFFFFGKSSQNSPKPVLIFWSTVVPATSGHLWFGAKVALRVRWPLVAGKGNS